MGEFDEGFVGLSADGRLDRYRRLAAAALEHYDTGKVTATFVGHNSGIAYRVETEGDNQRLLLKIYEPVGESDAVEPGRIRSVLLWLAALARDTDLMVQEPVSNRDGELLTAVRFDNLARPFCCSLQRWVEGEHAAGDIAPIQAHRIGTMMARLHEHGSRWTPPEGIEVDELNGMWLDGRLRSLRVVREAGIVSGTEWATVESAYARIRDVMEALGKGREVWGPIHGDLHQENLLFLGEDVWPIDFAGSYRAHFAWDLGVALYHLMYLDVGVRWALVSGYQEVRDPGDLQAEAFVCSAALDNLAFQATISSQRTSPLFVRNVREFVSVFCSKLASGEPFVFS